MYGCPPRRHNLRGICQEGGRRPQLPGFNYLKPVVRPDGEQRGPRLKRPSAVGGPGGFGRAPQGGLRGLFRLEEGEVPGRH